MSSPFTPLTEIASLHDRSDMHFSFNMSLSPVALSTKNTLPACQLGQKGLAQEERLQKKNRKEKGKEKLESLGGL